MAGPGQIRSLYRHIRPAVNSAGDFLQAATKARVEGIARPRGVCGDRWQGHDDPQAASFPLRRLLGSALRQPRKRGHKRRARHIFGARAQTSKSPDAVLQMLMVVGASSTGS
jgi:hypothetical protein